MPGLVAFLVTAAVVLQVPAGVLIYLDTRRLSLENPIAYFYGILVPAGGHVVIPAYLSRRSELPREAKAETETER